MKFAQELEANLTPEWKTKYLDYKQGKKKLKAVTRAIRNVEGPTSGRLNSKSSPFGSSPRDAPVLSVLNRGRDFVNRQTSNRNQLQVQRTRSAYAGSPWQAQVDLEQQGGTTNTPAGQSQPINERSPLRHAETDGDSRPGRMARYGSIIGTPPGESSPAMQRLTQQRTQASSLELPDPALDPQRSNDEQRWRDHDPPHAPETPPAVAVHEEESMPNPPQSQLSHRGNAYKIDRAVDAPLQLKQSNARSSHTRRTHTFPHIGRRPAFLRRVLSSKVGGTSAASNSLRENADVALEAYREVDFRRAEFFLFLDGQLEKIDNFYVEKEKEATERLNVLRDQLHILRDRRNEELAAAEQQKRKAPANGEASRPATGEDSNTTKVNGNHEARNSVAAHLDGALDKVRAGHLGKTSKAMRELGTPNFRLDPNNLDFARKQQDEHISYRTAKRKLKTALTEFYRGLELLKAYALLNRTAFRKITKKADKTIPWTEDKGAPGREYMFERVNLAKFVTGDEIDTLMQTTEDYYARYFERGNRKMAISKLRSKHYKQLDYHAAFFRAGVFGASGTVLCILAVIKGAKINFSPNHYLQIEAGYLLQIYGGYFLMLLAVVLFCIGAREFTRSKVNYHFILELNTRHSLNWRQLSEIPAFFLLILGLVMYLNFSWVGGDAMFIYWPVLLVGLAAITLFAPIPEFYWKSRYWTMEAFWRLLFSGIYPVQFKDLFLGDLMCSQTYAFGNVVLFFCLYARHWQDPPQCNSGHSMLFGFFTTLPAIFRLAQCLRRYGDTRAAFPHLANAGKYTCTILSYTTLSLFRLNKSYERLAVFTTFSAINGVYCSIWDVIMDFSLGDPSAKRPFLRKELQYEWYWYYIAMVVDPILRFNWIFYVIFAFDVQHASLNSFLISLAEVLRRGMWTMIRIENEHCTNVRLARATINPSMPFAQRPQSQRHGSGVDVMPEGDIMHTDSREGSQERAEEEGRSTGAERFRQGVQRVRDHQQKQKDSPAAQTFKRVGHIMAAAHAFDYERKKPPDGQGGDGAEDDDEDEDDDDDDDEDDGLRE